MVYRDMLSLWAVSSCFPPYVSHVVPDVFVISKLIFNDFLLSSFCLSWTFPELFLPRLKDDICKRENGKDGECGDRK